MDTALVAAGQSLAGHRHEARYRGVIADLFRSGRSVSCIVCRRSPAIERPIGGLLLACAAHKPKASSVSAICLACWTAYDADLIEQAATRVLRTFVKGGRFVDPPPIDTS
ncbi:hypothetical protein CP49_18080 [Bradyrhizobium valentinum]|uniref:Uncharacterized protein n=2 Tax=Bradyrhizobium valentinum TaxID=1518501 RepID=A0A0R3LU36_9BRAD|nr:hypothetical protein CP49_18080 [Bradyrhizobium valentinum]